MKYLGKIRHWANSTKLERQEAFKYIEIGKKKYHILAGYIIGIVSLQSILYTYKYH